MSETTEAERRDGVRMPVLFVGHGSPMNAIEDKRPTARASCTGTYGARKITRWTRLVAVHHFSNLRDPLEAVGALGRMLREQNLAARGYGEEMPSFLEGLRRRRPRYLDAFLATEFPTFPE